MTLPVNWPEMEPVLGSPQDVQRFIANVIQRFNGDIRETRSKGVFLFEPGDLRDRIVARAGKPLFPLSIAFDGVAPPGGTLLGRNNPAVATAAEAVLAQALRGQDSRFARSSAIFTNAVELRTAVLVLRLRYLIEEPVASLPRKSSPEPSSGKATLSVGWHRSKNNP